MTDDDIRCSFCQKTQKQVKKLIAGDNVHICDECVDLCHKIILEDSMPRINLNGSIPNPKQIKEFLDLYVIGQDYAKTVLSVSVHNHYKRLENPIIDDVEIEKSNVLLMGSTGVGKTLMARTIARFLDVPFAITDATGLTEAGYVGDSVENIIFTLYQASGNNVEKCQRGIIYVDEIDKLAKYSESASVTRDVGGEGVQQSLLKIFEGTTCQFPPEGGKKDQSQEMIEIDTTNILFIVGGAFVGLDKIVQSRKNKNSSIGFGAHIASKSSENQDISDLLFEVVSKDFHKFGLIPEFVGRFPVKAPLKDLDESELIQILTEPKNSLCKQYQKMFGLEKIQLEFTPDCLYEVARQTKLDKTGARGLRGIFEKKLLKLQFDLPELSELGVTKITIDRDFIIDQKQPKMYFGNKDEETAD